MHSRRSTWVPSTHPVRVSGRLKCFARADGDSPHFQLRQWSELRAHWRTGARAHDNLRQEGALEVRVQVFSATKHPDVSLALPPLSTVALRSTSTLMPSRRSLKTKKSSSCTCTPTAHRPTILYVVHIIRSFQRGADSHLPILVLGSRHQGVQVAARICRHLPVSRPRPLHLHRRPAHQRIDAPLHQRPQRTHSHRIPPLLDQICPDPGRGDSLPARQ